MLLSDLDFNWFVSFLEEELAEAEYARTYFRDTKNPHVKIPPPPVRKTGRGSGGPEVSSYWYYAERPHYLMPFGFNEYDAPPHMRHFLISGILQEPTTPASHSTGIREGDGIGYFTSFPV